MSILAVIAVSLAVGTWLGIRWAEASHRIDRSLNEVLMSLPVDDWDDLEAADRDRWRWGR